MTALPIQIAVPPDGNNCAGWLSPPNAAPRFFLSPARNPKLPWLVAGRADDAACAKIGRALPRSMAGPRKRFIDNVNRRNQPLPFIASASEYLGKTALTFPGFICKGDHLVSMCRQSFKLNGGRSGAALAYCVQRRFTETLRNICNAPTIGRVSPWGRRADSGTFRGASDTRLKQFRLHILFRFLHSFGSVAALGREQLNTDGEATCATKKGDQYK